MASRIHMQNWLFVMLFVAAQLAGVHAHACSDGNIDCLAETHADAVVHADEACADETCVDIRVDAAEGVQAKSLDVDTDDVFAVLPVVGLVDLPAPAQAIRPVFEALNAASTGIRLTPPARAPPTKL